MFRIFGVFNTCLQYIYIYIRYYVVKVDDFVGVLVAYIKRPVNYVVGRIVLRPHAAIYGRNQYVHIVRLAVKGVWHDHGQSVLLVLPVHWRVQ